MLLAVPGLVWACPDYLDTELRKLHSSDSVNLCEAYGGQAMLVVNTASRCGYTGQFEGLEELHQRYKEEEAANVCRVKYGVTFTMIAPSAVTGADANPVFAALSQQEEAPRWNFQKYVLDGEGELVASFPSQVQPSDEALQQAVESALAGEQ